MLGDSPRVACERYLGLAVHGGEGLTDGQGSSVESDAFVYLSAEDAREAWLAVSSPTYAECVVAEARRQAQALGAQLVPGEVLESPVGAAEEGISAVRLAYPPAAGQARPTEVDRVWIQRAGRWLGCGSPGQGSPSPRRLHASSLSRWLSGHSMRPSRLPRCSSPHPSSRPRSARLQGRLGRS
ncbi:MAG: hypothetical protein OXG37_05455 [Actinomycetia bacterium]|nr:hypothetical protein [Actinomycetes bacterium]